MACDTLRTLRVRPVHHIAYVSCVMLGRMTAATQGAPPDATGNDTPPAASETTDLIHLHDLIRSGDARKIRESAGITAGTIAADLGVSRATVARWEAGTHMPSRMHAVAYLALLRKIRSAA